jgi:hypothetical protein
MTEAVTAIESLSGKRVMVPAPSSPSVEVLRAEGFMNAETLQQFQINSELKEQGKGEVLWLDEAVFCPSNKCWSYRDSLLNTIAA